MFEISFKRFVRLLLPTFLRRQTIAAMLDAMTSPAVTLHNAFLQARSNDLYRLRITPQVCYLRRALNDAFPDAPKKLRIEDASHGGQWVFAWNAAAQYQQLMIPDTDGVIIWDTGAIYTNVGSFIVYAPSALESHEAKIKSILNTYKLVSRNYIIIYEQH